MDRICLIVNSSEKPSSAKIENYTGLFGELHFENRGELAIKHIQLMSYSFKMRKNTGLGLEEDFTLESSDDGFEVNIGRGSPFIFYIGYLYDNGKRMLCDPRYIENGKPKPEEIAKKRIEDNQLRCYLPVIIDLFEEVTMVFKMTAQDGSEYTQAHTLRIELEGEGGIYKPISEIPIKI